MTSWINYGYYYPVYSFHVFTYRMNCFLIRSTRFLGDTVLLIVVFIHDLNNQAGSSSECGGGLTGRALLLLLLYFVVVVMDHDILSWFVELERVSFESYSRKGLTTYHKLKVSCKAWSRVRFITHPREGNKPTQNGVWSIAILPHLSHYGMSLLTCI